MNEQRLCELVDALLESRISEAEREELRGILQKSAAARDLYWEMIELDIMLRDTVQESLGRDLAQQSLDTARDAGTPVPPLSSLAEAGKTGKASQPNKSGKPAKPGKSSSPISGGSDDDRGHERERDHDRGRSRDRDGDRDIPEQFAARWAAERRHSPSPWLAGTLLLALLGLIGWGIGDWRRQPRPVAPPTAAAASATLSVLEGAAWRVVVADREIKIAPGQTFQGGDTLRVGESSFAEVVLADGSRLGLGTGAVLRFPENSGPQRGELYLGRGVADVTAVRQSPDRPLVIATVAARLTVLGTQFRLYTSPDNSRVELLEGKVRFERRVDGQAVDVAAGQYAIATTQVAPRDPLVARTLDFQWRLRHIIERGGERVAFSHDSAWLATARQNQVSVWDVATGEPCYQHATVARLDLLCFSRDNAAIVGLSHRGPWLEWSFADRTGTTTDLVPVAGKMRMGAISRDGRWIAQATGADPGCLAVWNNERAGMLLPLPPLPAKAIAVAIATPPAGPLVVAADEHGGIAQWEATTGRELSQFRLESPLHLIELSPDGRWLGGFGNEMGLLLLDLSTGLARELWPNASVRVNDLRFAADGRSLYAAMADGVARGWSTADGQPLVALATGDARLRAIDVSPDGRWLAVAGDRERITLWQLEPAPQR
jgi:ferric-dicitrate binding protein FerR (iron transport regulator)